MTLICLCGYAHEHPALAPFQRTGARLAEIAEVLGHKSLQMTKRYTHYTNLHTAGIVERMAQQFLAP